jgi:hypothetical protein
MESLLLAFTPGIQQSDHLYDIDRGWLYLCQRDRRDDYHGFENDIDEGKWSFYADADAIGDD